MSTFDERPRLARAAFRTTYSRPIGECTTPAEDASGPCANAVKDAQRTKTSASTLETLTVIWAPVGFEALLAAARAWSLRLLVSVGATVVELA